MEHGLGYSWWVKWFCNMFFCPLQVKSWASELGCRLEGKGLISCCTLGPHSLVLTVFQDIINSREIKGVRCYNKTDCKKGKSATLKLRSGEEFDIQKLLSNNQTSRECWDRKHTNIVNWKGIA
ncbi:hypothetical protein Ahy_A07g031520 [Arachis hypogaea]|uniref:Uncharacterized protein n=1 Tax=Arachis hypogaea TaxID=3818 RepID=A0A445C441_ARAHY|nr:hypothetical protein Ahy_A07g031520 [Arachis hypogaea]